MDKLWRMIELALVCDNLGGGGRRGGGGGLNSDKPLVHSIVKIPLRTFHLRGIFVSASTAMSFASDQTIYISP